jgi:hypothetical protein
VATKPIVRRALGLVHTRWLLWPKKAAVTAGLFYVGVMIAAGALGILWTFRDPAGREIAGVGNSHWGPLFLFAMPLAAVLLGYYLTALENGLQSIDEVVVPVSQTTAQPFSGFVSGRLRYAWMSWMFPLALATPVILTIVADGRDIIAPLQSRVIPPSKELDWSTAGYLAHPERSPLWYFVFNLLAWCMQIFVGYCAVLVILLTAFLLGVVFRYGLGGRSITKIFTPPSVDPPPEKYQPRWDCTKRRCGLEDLDVIFGFFVALVIFVLLVCSVSILANAYLKKGPDLGSAILAFGAVLLLPAAVFWVFQPYFTNFPKELPADLKGKPGYVEPSPWPFGSEKLAWGTVGAAWALWAFLVWTVLKFIFKGIAD